MAERWRKWRRPASRTPWPGRRWDCCCWRPSPGRPRWAGPISTGSGRRHRRRGRWRGLAARGLRRRRSGAGSGSGGRGRLAVVGVAGPGAGRPAAAGGAGAAGPGLALDGGRAALSLYDPDSLRRGRAALEEACGRLWDERDRLIKDRSGESDSAEEQIQTNLATWPFSG